jgi:hypothetical protein
MYLKCPRQWAFRYIEQLKIPPSGAMKLSGVFHSTAERNYRQKASSQHDLPLDEQTDFFRDEWKDQLQREEVNFDEGDTPASLETQGIAIVKEHHTKIAPVVIPQSAEAVEEKILLPLVQKSSGVQYELDARIDVTDINNIIRDNKALGKTPNQMDVDRDIQLSTYALAKRIQTKKPETALALDIVVKNKTAPKAVTLVTERSHETLKLHLNLIGHVAKGIQAEVFPPNPTGWWCSKKFCGYWDRCMGRGLVTVDMGNGRTVEYPNIEHQLKESIDAEANRKQQEQTGESAEAPAAS